MENKNLFRKSALERLSTPEQLDTLLEVVSPQSWLILFGLLILVVAGFGWTIFEQIPQTLTIQGVLISETDIDQALESETIVAELDGSVRQVLVESGEYVEAGQVLFVLADENDAGQDVSSHISGLIINMNVEEGDRITPGLLLSEILPMTRDKDIPIEVAAYVSVYDAQYIEVGMPVEVSPLNVPQQEYGFLEGEVRAVGQFPSNTSLAQNFMTDGVPVIEIRLALHPDEDVPSGYVWSIGQGPDDELQVGVVSTVNIIIGMQRPIQRILPIFE